MPLLTGFHGKLPVAGDFLTRGLPVGFAGFWDRWAAQHLAPLQTSETPWPEGGLRLRLVSGGKVAAGVVLPGADRVGRRFPLSAFVIAADLPGPAGLDPWCGAAAGLLRGAQRLGQGPDDLLDALDDLLPPGPGPGGEEEAPAFLIWVEGRPPQACDPAEPARALTALFG